MPDTSVSQCIGEYVTNAVRAAKDGILDELKKHGKARLGFSVAYRMLDSGEISIDLEQRLSHSADVRKTNIGSLKQQQLPGM